MLGRNLWELDNPGSAVASTPTSTYRLASSPKYPWWRSAKATEMRPLAIEQWLKTLALQNLTKDKLRRVMSSCSSNAARHEQLMATHIPLRTG
jgi:hypothetical protein